MGISNRDYLRDDEGDGRGPGWLADTPVVRQLIIANVVCFILQIFTQTPGGLSLMDRWFAMTPDALFSGQIWRFFTYGFLHDIHSPWHILFNMLGLWFLGTALEGIYGSREFLAFYCVSVVFAAVGFVALMFLTRLPMGIMLGASGGVMAVFVLFVMHFPHQTFYLYFFPVKAWVLLLIYIVMDGVPMLNALAGQGGGGSVAHGAHLAGLLFGWLYYRNRWRVSGWFGFDAARWRMSWRRMTSGRKLRVYRPADPPEPTAAVDLEAELDRILAKIHEQGSESLTDRERRVLTQASEAFKRRS
jgi:membrane associated rhomboid family serine protease